MSATPFKSVPDPFVGPSTPMPSKPLQEVKRELEDVPFESGKVRSNTKPRANEAKSPDDKEREDSGLLGRFFSGRNRRKLREEQLNSELQDLRASYAGLLSSTESIKDSLVTLKDAPKAVIQPVKTEKASATVSKTIQPFPNPIPRLEKLQTRQDEAAEVLTSIRKSLDEGTKKNEKLETTLNSVQTGVGKLQGEIGNVRSEVKGFTKSVTKIAEKQATTSANLGDLGKKVDERFEEAATTARENLERLENSGEDMLNVLRDMEKNSQRYLWVFAVLFTVLFVLLIAFSIRVGQNQASRRSSSPEALASAPSMVKGIVVEDTDALVLGEDDFAF